ncbi:MAG: diguanylate cyclase [Planctomycetia bacterium]|nr:diguanylate cyclase [Planctomycetia bacterium]
MRINAIFRITLTLASVVVGVLLIGLSLHFFPHPDEQRAQARKTLCESVAIQCCLAVERSDALMMTAILQSLKTRSTDVASAGIRQSDGRMRASTGDHDLVWRAVASEELTRAEVPIFSGKKLWGKLEVAFVELDGAKSLIAHLSSPARFVLFAGCLVFLLFLVYLGRMLQFLNPAEVVPDRVRQALDTLSEGVVIVDRKERIVLANSSFALHVGEHAESLQGRRIKGFSRLTGDDIAAQKTFPWSQSLLTGEAYRGVLLRMVDKDHGHKMFAVNSAPIVDADGRSRGVMATFDDVSEIERKNNQLRNTLQVVNRSRDEIRRQNRELETMATCDALTGCFNRRYLFTQLEKLKDDLGNKSRVSACILLDIDHFKSINDTHGHAKGDEVLQGVAAILRGNVGPDVVVCRYGGEEFCALLPGKTLEQARGVAELLRAAICAAPIGSVPVASSFGVTDTTCGAEKPADLMEQADQALYYSKRTGRNRVTGYRDIPADFSAAAEKH